MEKQKESEVYRFIQYHPRNKVAQAYRMGLRDKSLQLAGSISDKENATKVNEVK